MKKSVLIVDDNPVNLKLAADVLECEGFDVLKAIDAEHAQVLLESANPDLILMDIALPGMDGLTLTSKLKGDPRFKSTPIIALTAFAMKGDDQRAFNAGCNGYITKPINTRELPRQVRAWIDSQASGEPNA
jgi:CheY-like chemotaxis protein